MTSKAESVTVLRNTLATMARITMNADLPALAFILRIAELEAALAEARIEAKATTKS